MKLMADRLLSMPPTGDEYLERARCVLKIPSRNHTVDASNFTNPGCDRYVFDREDVNALSDHFEEDAESRLLATEYARLPSDPCWLECENLGFLVWKDGQGAVPLVGFIGGRGHALVGSLAYVDFGQIKTLDAIGKGRTKIELLQTGRRVVSSGSLKASQVSSLLFKAIVMMAAMSSPRVTTVRKVSRDVSALNSAERAFRMRRAQRGRPVFSYNKVDLVLPKTALHRGVLKPAESFAGMRGHFVMGHWRLIDGVLEPYWTWVDGHKRGDPELGWITKERHVDLSRVTRRGYLVPAQEGHPGQRVRAIPTADCPLPTAAPAEPAP